MKGNFHMRVIAPYKFNPAHAADEVAISLPYNDRGVCLDLVNAKLHHIGDEIKKFSLSDDINNTLFSKEMKYRKYRKLLTDVRHILEESLFSEGDELLLNYENFSIFYAAVMSEYNKLMTKIDARGYDIIDKNLAVILNAVMDNEASLSEIAETVDDLLYPEHNKFIDALEEKFWIIDNDGCFTGRKEMEEEEKNIGIFIHEYETEYLAEYLDFFRETIEKKPAKKTYGALRLHIGQDRAVSIKKETQIDFINSTLASLEKWIPGDRTITLSASEYILFAMLINGFYMRLSERFEDYSCEITEIEHGFVFTSFVQTRLFLPYVKPIENYKEPVFNRYFYDN